LYRKNNPTFDESSNEHKKFVADLRGQLNKALRSGRSAKEIAAASFVCEGTIKRYADGKTEMPSFFTLKYVAEALGLRIALVPIETPPLPGEIS